MKARIFMLCLCGLLCCSDKIPVLAAETVAEDVTSDMSRMANVDNMSATLNISSTGLATVTTTVYGITDVTTRISITANLERYENGSWISVKTFTKNSNSAYAKLSQTCQVSKGYTYRVSARVNAYSASSSAGKTITSSNVTY